MSIPTSYMPSVINVEGILNAMQTAQVPDRFNREFLNTLGFKGSNDRSIISVLKDLGYLDQSGVPTERYRAHRNKAEAPYVLAESIRGAYSDIFLADEHAEKMKADRVKGIIATKVDKGDSVIQKMTSTFTTLVKWAKWDRGATAPSADDDSGANDEINSPAPVLTGLSNSNGAPILDSRPQYHYNIQLHLPATKDISIYNAIFKSVREHLIQ